MTRPHNAIPLLSLLCNSLLVLARSHARSVHHAKRDDCFDSEPTDTLVDRMNTALNSSGAGYTLSLCPDTEYPIDGIVTFFANGQEISTLGYPTDDSRAMLYVSTGVSTDSSGTKTGVSTVIQGNCADCDNIKLRNVQINGSRTDANAWLPDGGANIEMGGDNSGQVVEYVHSFDPRGWSCLHITEGTLKCTNATVQNNDIGPCGSDTYGEWADGISFSCASGNVRNNILDNPTDGGIVLFGAPGSLIENNTIYIEENTLLGGINMVDYLPWSGNFSNTVVRNNTIYGGFADDGDEDTQTKGDDVYDAIIKVGIAIGPRIWFGARSLSNTSYNGTVENNYLSGAFGYGIAIASAQNFTVQGNSLLGNTSFIGKSGSNCSSTDSLPEAQDFIYEKNTTKSCTLSSDFTGITDGNDLICLTVSDGDYWPYGNNPNATTSSQSSSSSGSSMDTSDKIGLAVGIIVGILFIAALAWYIRKWAMQRNNAFGTTGNVQQPSQRGFVRGNF